MALFFQHLDHLHRLYTAGAGLRAVVVCLPLLRHSAAGDRVLTGRAACRSAKAQVLDGRQGVRSKNLMAGSSILWQPVRPTLHLDTTSDIYESI